MNTASRYQAHCAVCFAVFEADSAVAALNAAQEHEAKQSCKPPKYDSVTGIWSDVK